MNAGYKDSYSPENKNPPEPPEFDPELVDPTSPANIYFLFNESVTHFQDFYILEETEIIDINTDNVLEICDIFSKLLFCFSNGKIIEEKDVISPLFYTPIRILLEKAEVLDIHILEVLIDVVHLVVAAYSNPMIYEFAHPLINITLNSNGQLLQRASIIVANLMAESNSKSKDQLISLQLLMHRQLSDYFLQIIDINSDTTLMCNIFIFFANLLYQSWINFMLMPEISKEKLSSLAAKVMAFISPAIDDQLVISAVNLIVEISRFEPQIPILKELGIVNKICSVMEVHSLAQDEFNSPDLIFDEEELFVLQTISHDCFCIINIITNEELKSGEEISFFKDQRFDKIIHSAICSSFPPTKQLAFKLLSNTSGICHEFYHEKGIMLFLIEIYGKMNYSEKLFLLAAFVHFLSTLPKEIAQEYMNETFISIAEELIDDCAIDSTEMLSNLFLELMNDELFELLNNSTIPNSLEDFIDENEEKCIKTKELFEILNQNEE